jgi:hypothetical protein
MVAAASPVGRKMTLPHCDTESVEGRGRIGSWIEYYNRQHPHSSFDGSTPDEVYATAEMPEQLAT